MIFPNHQFGYIHICLSLLNLSELSAIRDNSVVLPDKHWEQFNHIFWYSHFQKNIHIFLSIYFVNTFGLVITMHISLPLQLNWSKKKKKKICTYFSRFCNVRILPSKNILIISILIISPSIYKSIWRMRCWDFEIQTDHLILDRPPDLVIINNNNKKKNRTWRKVDFTVPADHRVKLKESEKKDNYLHFAWESRKKNCGTWKGKRYQL